MLLVSVTLNTFAIGSFCTTIRFNHVSYSLCTTNMSTIHRVVSLCAIAARFSFHFSLLFRTRTLFFHLSLSLSLSLFVPFFHASLRSFSFERRLYFSIVSLSSSATGGVVTDEAFLDFLACRFHFHF